MIEMSTVCFGEESLDSALKSFLVGEQYSACLEAGCRGTDCGSCSRSILQLCQLMLLFNPEQCALEQKSAQLAVQL
jgi:hypothetical protein